MSIFIAYITQRGSQASIAPLSQRSVSWWRASMLRTVDVIDTVVP